MSFDVDRLYDLLPAVYRVRDEALAGRDQKGPLKALLSVIADQTGVLERDLDQLYDDLFIETCAEWVVPYIGDLVNAGRIVSLPGARFSERAFVANTIAYRRRKGTAAVIEQLARDITGWNASVVEYFQLLATSQYMNHIRLENLSFADLGQTEKLEFVSTPFDKVSHTVDVRRISSQRGKYNISNVGIFLWRIHNYPISNSPAFKVDDRRYLFDALGNATQLYNNPVTETEITHLAEPSNVAIPLTRRLLARNLEKYYGVQAEGELASILINKNGDSVLPDLNLPAGAPGSKLSDLVTVCDLSDVTDSSGNVIGWAHKPEDKISIDPVLGRLAFPENEPPPQKVHVTYNYGFSAEMGGGEYNRGTSAVGAQEIVNIPTDAETIQSALTKLISKLSENPQFTRGVIEIEKPDTVATSNIYELGGTITVPPGKLIEIRAAEQHRPVIRLTGDLLISCEGDGQLLLDGLMISGGVLRVPETSKLRLLRLTHCTVVPSGGFQVLSPTLPEPSLLVESTDVTVELNSSITGAIGAVDGGKVSIHNSIVDSGSEHRVAYADVEIFNNATGPTPFGEPGASLKVVNSTIIGKVHTLVMELASNTIFLAEKEPGDLWPAVVNAKRLQAGCVRFSYVPPGSRLPRLYRCQPADTDSAAGVKPIFTSLRYGDAAYCQLSRLCAVEIRQGADDQAEMGVFHNLYQSQREANLKASLSEYLRFPLEAGIFFAS